MLQVTPNWYSSAISPQGMPSTTAAKASRSAMPAAQRAFDSARPNHIGSSAAIAAHSLAFAAASGIGSILTGMGVRPCVVTYCG
jgi:hypothetical protein